MATPIEGGEVQGDNTPQIPEGGEVTSGLNPAWNDVLSVLPEGYHAAVTPHFQQWDQAAQQRIEAANATAKAFDGFKPFADEGITPEEIQNSLQLMYQLNADPQAFYNALVETYGYGKTPGPESQENTPEGETPGEVFQDPRFDKLQQGLDLVAQTLLQQENQKLEKAAEAEIDAEVASLKESHPGISEDFIYSLMTNGYDAKTVGDKWAATVQGILQSNPRPFAPNVMGTSSGGTGLPSQAIDPTKLNGSQTRNLVVEMLNAANRQK